MSNFTFHFGNKTTAFQNRKKQRQGLTCLGQEFVGSLRRVFATFSGRRGSAGGRRAERLRAAALGGGRLARGRRGGWLGWAVEAVAQVGHFSPVGILFVCHKNTFRAI